MRPFPPASCQSGVSGTLTMSGGLVVLHFGAVALEFCPGGLGLQAPPLAGEGRFGGAARFWRRRGAPDEVEQALPGLGAVAFLSAMGPREDDQNTILGQTSAG